MPFNDRDGWDPVPFADRARLQTMQPCRRKDSSAVRCAVLPGGTRRWTLPCSGKANASRRDSTSGRYGPTQGNEPATPAVVSESCARGSMMKTWCSVEHRPSVKMQLTGRPSGCFSEMGVMSSM